MKYLIQKYIISMVSKNQIKLITSLQQKKYRSIEKLFLAEGVKVIQELLQSNLFNLVLIGPYSREREYLPLLSMD